MENIFNLPTTTLIDAVAQFKAPATYLVDNFFGQKLPVATTTQVAVEYKKGKRLLAPYIVSGGKGVSINRDKAQAEFYSAPMMGGKRIITIKELEMRQFGETPVYSTLTPADRAAQMQAQDLKELTDIIYNRRNKMAADILLGDPVVVKGFADDGTTVIENTIDFEFENYKTPSPLWSNASASIYDDLKNACDKIAEDTGTLPTMLLVGANVEKYLLANKEIKDWLLVSNNRNLTIASLMPKYTAPQTRYLGTIPALGLEIYSYLETYFDTETQQVKPFIPANTAIVLSQNIGRQLFGAISLMDKNSGVQTYAAEFVPKYSINEDDNIMSLSVYSRCLLVPNDIGAWLTFKNVG